MTLHPASRTGTGQGRRRRGALLRPLLLLLLAAVLSLLPILQWPPQWTLEPRMVPYIASWLLRPSSGFLSLTLVLWLLFTAPRALRVLGGARRSGEPAPDAGEEALADPGTSVPAGADRAEREELRIPAGTFRQLAADHRWEMAEALGIPWRDELIHDHQSWAVACLEAAQVRAATVRR